MNKTNIKEFYTRIVSNKYLPYVIIVLIGIITTVPLFTMNLSELNEFRIHIGRVTMVKEIIEDGVFPPFISYKHMLTFGYALNIFYGALTTYFPILISLLTGSTTIALKIFTLITVILSGITMYILSNRITKSKTIGLFASIIYMVAPYKFTDIYSRNAVGEYTAFIFIPMVFYGLHELINNNPKGRKWLIIGSALLTISHTITTIYTALFAILFLCFNFNKIKNWNFWKNILISIIWIVVLTAFYTIPLIEHKTYGDYLIFDSDGMGANGQYVYHNTNSITDWIKSEFAHSENPHEDLIFSFGITITFYMITTIFCYSKVNKKYKDLYGTYAILALISLFMCTKIFPWLAMPHFLTVIQFAWRLNGFFVFFISIVCGINAYVLSKMLSCYKQNTNKTLKTILQIKNIQIIMVMAIFIISGLGAFKYVKKYDNSIDKSFEQKMLEAESIGPYNINRDYMPLKALENIDYLQSRENKTYVLSGNATIRNENKYRLNDTIEIEDADNAKLELPYLYYHGYSVTINDKPVKTYESENGFLTIDLNENGNLEIKYTGTIIEKCGFIISLIGLIVALFNISKKILNNKGW